MSRLPAPFRDYTGVSIRGPVLFLHLPLSSIIPDGEISRVRCKRRLIFMELPVTQSVRAMARVHCRRHRSLHGSSGGLALSTPDTVPVRLSASDRLRPGLRFVRRRLLATTTGLFVAQRLDGIEIRGADRWEHAATDADQGKNRGSNKENLRSNDQVDVASLCVRSHGTI